MNWNKAKSRSIDRQAGCWLLARRSNSEKIAFPISLTSSSQPSAKCIRVGDRDVFSSPGTGLYIFLTFLRPPPPAQLSRTIFRRVTISRSQLHRTRVSRLSFPLFYFYRSYEYFNRRPTFTTLFSFSAGDFIYYLFIIFQIRMTYIKKGHASHKNDPS